MPICPHPFVLLVVAWCGIQAIAGLGLAQDETQAASDARRDFFEKHIRPALHTHCLECHATETEVSGGLLLDSRTGWLAGGDSGPAIIPGKSSESRLLKALHYDDPDLQMPPEGELPAEVQQAFAKWIDEGAFDPRESNVPVIRSQTGLPVERADEHWAYRPLAEVQPPPAQGKHDTHPIDRFINAKLNEHHLASAPPASRHALERRLAFDLTGLPPAASDLAKRADASGPEPFDPQEYEQWVDRLLNSPHFGETFARHWMDVARYAESITLRGFVLPEAWRYRDYLIHAFNSDRPFNQMVREQIAGDLLTSDDLSERHRQLTAMTFLTMGNTNLEQQDKTQLEMDYVDEQLEVMGRAFLGQTIGCARCHDHKFDPIPTRDYYALAGIFRSAVALKHANLSRWIEMPLPLPPEEEAHFEQLAAKVKEVDARIAVLKKKTNQKLAENQRLISVSELAGTVVDSSEAKLVGEWVQSTSVGRYIGDGYVHDGNTAKGQMTATFEPKQLPAGFYQVRLAYSASENRASNAQVRVFSADGEATVTIDQRVAPIEDALWISLGDYRFEKDGQAFVLVTNEGSDGHVIVDAVQFLPFDKDLNSLAESPREKQTPSPKVSEPENGEEKVRYAKELRQLEAQQKMLAEKLAARPHYMTIVEESAPRDLPLHIRGDPHNLGEIVPRGFLSAVNVRWRGEIASGSSGRLELADWLASDSNPLTPRVYVNRVWCWLMGQGLVPSVSNFGTTGTAPTHPELLDYLANELIRNGWSTKHLVRTIVMSQAYQRGIIDAGPQQHQIDPANRFYWRGHSRRLSVEALRDAMLQVSGELDTTPGGSLIRPNTNADYNYQHTSPRRSIYQPLFRNALPDLYDAFDFADPSVSTGQRPRSTVATQALVLLNHPWVTERAKAAATRLRQEMGDDDPQRLIETTYSLCFHRQPTAAEVSAGLQFLTNQQLDQKTDRLQLLIHSLFASLDFRYLD